MTARQLPLVLIAARGRNNVIGRDDGMPWRLPGDLAHFREATMGRPVIMGRKTFEAIGHPLPGRFLVVLSRREDYRPADVVVAASVEAALGLAQAIGTEHASDSVMVAGGGAVYRACLAQADALVITEVDLAPPGDTHFPDLDPAMWRVVERGPERRLSGDDAMHRVVRYERSYASNAFARETGSN